jgi:hypothetical protein
MEMRLKNMAGGFGAGGELRAVDTNRPSGDPVDWH